jgi:ubiquinone/menaquinone biosynthesis C-methylase UbiE
VDLILNRFDLRSYFDEIVTRDDGFAPKPDPAVFQHILSARGCHPWECIVIEDSHRGVSAATRLHIPCIVIPNEYAAKQFTYPPQTVVVRRLADVTVELVSDLLEAARPKTDFTLPQVFGDSNSTLDALFMAYRDLYGLKEFVHEDAGVSAAAFEYARKRRYFIILAMLTHDGQVYFQRSFDSGHLSLMLPGAAVHMEKGEGIYDAITRAAHRIIGDARLTDSAPVAFLRNRFRCEDGREIEHLGLGIRSLLLNSEDELARIVADIAVKGCFVRDYDPDQIEQAPSRNTYGQVREWLRDKRYRTYTHEIATQAHVLWRYKLHQATVNPVIRRLSRIVGQYSIETVKRRVRSHLQGSRVIDVACGDDHEVIELARETPLVVANDIAIDQIISLERRYREMKTKAGIPKAHALMFTNHDCLDLPFRKDAFDAALCRNLLHHMNTADDLQLLLTNLRRVARRVVVVEVEDPGKRRLGGRVLHSWYTKFLKDQGHAFFDRAAFQDVMHEAFKGDLVKLEYYPTIRSTYMLAIVDRR